MMCENLFEMSTTDLAQSIRRRCLSVEEVVEATLQRISIVNPTLNCFSAVYAEEALIQARKADQLLRGVNDPGSLYGVPFAIKDLTLTAGKKTTRGSRVFAHWVPDRDAVVVRRLKAAGGIMVGKTTTPEFAASGFTEGPQHGTTRNPWNVDRTPGGSSGGAAAAVASGCVSLAEGSDCGGSIRVPAAFCGVVGLKPSFGRIPFDILETHYHTLWHFGPLARTVEDAAIFLNITQGPEDHDIFSLPPLPKVQLPLSRDVRGLRCAVSLDLGYYLVDSDVAANTEACVKTLQALGATTELIELNWDVSFNEAIYDLVAAEMEALYSRFVPQWHSQMTPAVLDLIDRGSRLTGPQLSRIGILRTKLWEGLREVFAKYDVLVCPTTSIVAPPVGLSDMDFYQGPKEPLCRAIEMTLHFNLVPQCPAISIPSGLASNGLPTGIQIVGKRYADESVLTVAAAIEEARPWRHLHPPT